MGRVVSRGSRSLATRDRLGGFDFEAGTATLRLSSLSCSMQTAVKGLDNPRRTLIKIEPVGCIRFTNPLTQRNPVSLPDIVVHDAYERTKEERFRPVPNHSSSRHPNKEPRYLPTPKRHYPTSPRRSTFNLRSARDSGGSDTYQLSPIASIELASLYTGTFTASLIQYAT